MMMNRSAFFIMLVLVFACIPGILPAGVHIDSLEEPVDLGSSLTGAWEFTGNDVQENRLYNTGASDWVTIPGFPHDWRDPSHAACTDSRTAWYRLRFTMDKDDISDRLMFQLGPVNDADQTYLNGVQIGATGTLNENGALPLSHGYDRIRVYSIPDGLLTEKNILAVRVQHYFPKEAGFRDHDSTVVIGKEQHVQRSFYLSQLLPLSVFVVIITLAVYFLILFIRSTSTFENLFLAFCCMVFGLYYVLTTQVKYILFDNFMFFKRIEYILVISALYLFANYVYFFFRHHLNGNTRLYNVVLPALDITCLLLLLPILVSDNIILWDWHMTHLVEPLWLFPVGFILYILIQLVVQKRKDAILILGIFIVCLLAVLNDVLVHRSVFQWGTISHWPFLFMIFSIQQLSTGRFYREELMTPEKLENETNKNNDTPWMSPVQVEKMEYVVRFLRENYREDISREGLAARLDLSPDHMSRLFKKYTGKKFGRVLNEMRISDALERLESTDEPIIDIAFSVGFESLRTFNRVFRDITGSTPSVHRSRTNNTSKNLLHF